MANLILGSHLLFLVIGLLLLLFPDGRLPSPRWRWLLWYGAFRRVRGDERQQPRWFVYTVTVVIAAVVISIVVIFGNGRYSLALFALIPVPIAVGVLKYRLYDLDLVISKTIVFGTPALFITAIYAATVADAGALAGRRGSLALAAVAAELHRAAGWPGETPAPVTLPVTGAGGLPLVPGADRAVPVLHHGQLLGALTVRMPPGSPLTAAQDKLIRDLAGQAGLVLRNARLIEELRIDENPAQAHAALRDLQAQAGEAARDLRELAHGIYPPLLADRGLLDALAVQARRSPVPVVTESLACRHGGPP